MCVSLAGSPCHDRRPASCGKCIGLEGIPIWGTLSGSLAHRAGLRYGDVLLAVNGQRTRDAVAYVEARNARSDGLSVLIFRDGAELSIELSFEGRVSARPSREVVQGVAEEVIAGRLLPSVAPSAKPEPT